MAELEFIAASAKDTEKLATDQETAAENGVTLDIKKGIITVAGDSALEAGSSIDISGSAFFKTVGVSSEYAGAVAVTGSGLYANVVSLGGGGGTVFGGSMTKNDKDKDVTSADKFYGGEGTDYFVYEANGGKDAIYNYGEGDVVSIGGLGSTQSLSFVDKSGGLTVTISDSADEKAGTTAKNSVLTIDGKTKTASKFILTDGSKQTVYGAMPDGVTYGTKKNGTADTSILNIGEEASGDVNVNLISSLVKTITGTNTNAVNITGNGNANKITIGAGGGTIDGGYGAKATNDVLYGTTDGAVTFVYDAVMGGKDVIGDAKLTQYNYKGGDTIVITNGNIAAEGGLALKGADAIITIDRNNTLTIKNALGKALNIQVDDEEYELPNNWAILDDRLTYDAKLSKITANNAVITAGSPTNTISTYVAAGTDAEGETLYKRVDKAVYATVTLGADDSSSYAASVKEIDLSAADAPVVVNTDLEDYSVTTVKVGSVNSTVTASSDVAGQTFQGGSGTDLFIFPALKVNADAPKAKADTITNLAAGDQISIKGLDGESDLSFVEKGKDLNILVGGYTVITVKNFDSDAGLTVLGDEGFSKGYPKTITNVTYADKKGKIDKSGLVGTGEIGASVVSAADFGDSAIKSMDFSAVTKAGGKSNLMLEGSSNANTIILPTASVATTVNGGAGNDAYTAGGGKNTFVFEAQEKGKKDTITNYKTGDVIVIDQSILEESEGAITAELAAADDDESATPKGTITYDNGKGVDVDGFNDTKADVVVTINKSNTITIKNGAGKQILLQDGIGGTTYSFGHVLPTGLAYDAKNTAVTLASDASYSGDINLSDYGTYYNTIKKVDMTGNSVAVNIYGNTLANELIAGSGGALLDGGAVDGLKDAKDAQIKPAADKLTGGAGKDTFVYDVGYGKDSFLSFGSGDVVSLGAGITKDNLSIVDKKNVLTVSIVDMDWDTEKGAAVTAANSIFTITKESDAVPVSFKVDGGSFDYGKLPDGASIDAKYASITADTADNVTIDASMINSQPKVIDAKKATGTALLIGNANADAIYAGQKETTLFGGTAGTKAVKDALYGGAGADYFLFSSQGGAKGKETDIVYNYNSETDVIVLEREPDLVKADGKTVTFTFSDPDPVKEGKTVASTLVINGTAVDDTMKKFNPITANYAVKVAVLDDDLYGDDGKLVSLSGVTATAYVFDSTNKALKGGKSEGLEGEGISVYGEGSDEEEQLAAGIDDYWFTEDDAAKIEVAGTELDEILEVKGSTAAAAQFNADSYFTGIGDADQAAASALTYAARHQAKK